MRAAVTAGLILTTIFVFMLLALVNLCGCKSVPSVAPTITTSTDVTLKQVQDAVITTIQDTFQTTITQSYHDIGEEQAKLETTRLAGQNAVIACVILLFLGGWIVVLFLPEFNISAKWTAVGIAFGIIMFVAGAGGLLWRFVL